MSKKKRLWSRNKIESARFENVFTYILYAHATLNRQSEAAVLDRIYAEVDSSLIAWTESRRTCFSPYAICFSVIIVPKQN
jgi:hypothetical protein